MACELIGARMLSPYFGTSLYVWAAALGITLGGLMCGYFLGGLISRHVKDNHTALYIVLILAAAFLFLMPFTSKWIMDVALNMSIQTGALLSLGVFMFPPLVFMGMVSPLIINILTNEAKVAGNSAGNVYAISTLGGILATFALGFYLIPEFGITRPSMIGGILLAIMPVVSLIRRRRNYLGVLILVFLIGFGFAQPFRGKSSADYKTLYHSEGVLGQVKVIEFQQADGKQSRGLVVNNTLQTVINIDDPAYDYWPYTRVMQHFASQYPAESNVLLLGMGGGTVARRLQELDMQMDIVEIDQRMIELAQTWFDLDRSLDVYIDDARHFVKVSHSTYDIIIYDVFKGEEAPGHILTRESLEETKTILAEDGMLLVNFYGYLEGSLGLLTRSVYKTMLQAGFDCALFTTPGSPDQRNVILVAWGKGRTNPLTQEYATEPLQDNGANPISLSQADIASAFILTDERPQVQLFAQAAMQWRRLYNAYFLK